jgi:hypothetical protein
MSHSNNKNTLNVVSANSRRLAGDVVVSDGTTSNRAQVQTPGARGNLAGAPLASWVGWVDVPSANPSATCRVFYIGPSTSPSVLNVSELTFAIGTLGQAVITQKGTVTSANERGFSYSSFRAIYSGQKIWLEVRFAKGTADPIVRVNNIDISSSFSAFANDTPPEWLDSGIISTYHLNSFNWPAGPAPLGCWLNAHLTNQESYNWMISGQPPFWVQSGGGMISQNTSVFVNTIGSSGYEVFSGASATGFTAEATDNYSQAAVALPVYIGGTRAQMIYDLTVTSGQVPRAVFNGQGPGSKILTVGTNQVVSIEASGPRSAGMAIFTTLPSSFTISNVRIVPEGALSLPNIQPIPVIDDGTTIGDNPAFLVGMTPIVQDETKPCRIRKSLSWAGTHEQKTLFEGTSVTLPGNVVIQDIDTKATAASTGSGLTVGTTGTGNRYVSANTFTTAKKVHTLANQIPSSTAANQLNIAVDPDTNNYTGTITTTVILNLQGDGV